MKNSILLTYHPQIGLVYNKILSYIFEDYCHFENYSSQSDILKEPKVLSDIDLFIMSDSLSNFNKDNNFNISNTKIIDIQASFAKDRLDMLKSIEEPIHFIFRYKYLDTCIRVIDILRGYDIKNFTWSHQPSYPILRKENFLNIVIKEPFFDIDKTYLKGTEDFFVYDLGNRRISFNSLMEIKRFLKIDDMAVTKKIINHVSSFSSIDSINFSIFKESTISENSLDKLISYIDSSIVFLDSDLNIIKSNDNFINKFNKEKKLNLKDITILDKLTRYLRSGKKLDNHVITNSNNNQSFIVSSEYLEYMDGILESSNYMVIIDDVDKLNKKQEKYRNTLIAKGHYSNYRFSDILGTSPSLKEAIKIAQKMALIDKTTLIVGETGSGKELFAHAIHSASCRKNNPFVSINCAAIPNNLLESELFGYEPGTFSGGLKEGKVGLFEIANGGTLFLDEIGELDYNIQSKLLRAIETKEIMKIGGSSLKKIDIRILAATNRDLVDQVKKKEFREDLYYRLNNFEIQVPPLRQRLDDVIGLVENFMIEDIGSKRNMSENLREFLLTYTWPGNIRELKNVTEYMINIHSGELDLESLPMYLKNRITKNPLPASNSGGLTQPNKLKTYDPEILGLIVKCLAQNEIYSRKAIHPFLKAKQVEISDYKLRNILSYLRDQAYIDYSQGPGRIVATNKGLEFLKTLGQGLQSTLDKSKNI